MATLVGEAGWATTVAALRAAIITPAAASEALGAILLSGAIRRARARAGFAGREGSGKRAGPQDRAAGRSSGLQKKKSGCLRGFVRSK
jgi:hypothetical protein